MAAFKLSWPMPAPELVVFPLMLWFENVPLFGKTKYMIRCVGVDKSTIKKMFQWCNDNNIHIKLKGWSIMDTEQSDDCPWNPPSQQFIINQQFSAFEIYFKNEENAMAFKLRWSK